MASQEGGEGSLLDTVGAAGETAEVVADQGDGEAKGEEEVEELVELQVIEEARLEKLFAELEAQRGLDDEVTLKTFFKLFDMWIQLYRLNKCAEVLQRVVPICRQRGGQLHIQAVQALAFTLWKQSKFKESVKLFHEMEELVPASSALCENMGHTYSSMGNFEQASKYFKRALACIDAEEKSGQEGKNRAGVLLGLGLIEDRQGNLDEALVRVAAAQELFRLKAGGKPSSLIAKAGMSRAKILLKLAAKAEDQQQREALEEQAVELETENVALFEVTCGEDSPLTASALRGLGEALVRRKRMQEALTVFARSYQLEAQKDAFDLITIMEVHNLLVGVHMATVSQGAGLDRKAFRTYVPAVETALGRVRQMTQDANAGAYYKVAGELLAFAEDYPGASSLLGEALELFATEQAVKVGDLCNQCRDLKTFCDKQAAPRLAQAKQQLEPQLGGSAVDAAAPAKADMAKE